jgi:hypothetical protein
VGANAIRLYGEGSLHACRVLRRAKLRVHSPGEIVAESETDRGATFTVRGWPAEPWYVLLNGLRAAPAIKVNGAPTSGDFDERAGTLVLKLTGLSRIEINW